MEGLAGVVKGGRGMEGEIATPNFAGSQLQTHSPFHYHTHTQYTVHVHLRKCT